MTEFLSNVNLESPITPGTIYYDSNSQVLKVLTYEGWTDTALKPTYDGEALLIGKVVKMQKYIKDNKEDYGVSYFLPADATDYCEVTIAGWGNAIVLGYCVTDGFIQCSTVYLNAFNAKVHTVIQNLSPNFIANEFEEILKKVNKVGIGDLYL